MSLGGGEGKKGEGDGGYRMQDEAGEKKVNSGLFVIFFGCCLGSQILLLSCPRLDVKQRKIVCSTKAGPHSVIFFSLSFQSGIIYS